MARFPIASDSGSGLGSYRPASPAIGQKVGRQAPIDPDKPARSKAILHWYLQKSPRSSMLHGLSANQPVLHYRVYHMAVKAA